MNCPQCNSASPFKDGKTPSGNRRYECKDCGKRFVPVPMKRGRKPKGKAAMTDAERQRLYKLRKRKDG